MTVQKPQCTHVRRIFSDNFHRRIAELFVGEIGLRCSYSLFQNVILVGAQQRAGS